jgi:hypothetical protein
MDCKKILEIFQKTCNESVKCYQENYNLNYPVADALHTKNCISIMKLKVKYCPDKKVLDKKK